MRSIIFAALMAASATAWANHPDSVYVKAYSPNPSEGLRVAYSVDKKTWIPVGNRNLFKSDYGTWGAEKKMHFPVLSYDGKTFHAEFVPNPKFAQIGTTQSTDLFLWKPQDYPYLTKSEFDKKKAQLEAASKDNIIKVPYEVIESLVEKVQAAELRGQWEGERLTSKALENFNKPFATELTVSLNERKAISPELMGMFFEDINYAADGGLYAELIQNRDFEYCNDDNGGWNAKTAWKLEGNGTEWTIAEANPIHKNNAHYSVLKTTVKGAKLINEGWDGIVLTAKDKYNLSVFTKGRGKLKISLVSDGKTVASTIVGASAEWKQQKAILTANASVKNAQLVIEPQQEGEISIDFVSLFPQKTYKNRANGMRADLAKTLADMKPQFVRFPGGCASHGQGIDNIYHWQATVGDLWERQPDMNIWHYHQSRGIGFYEYFQFCEDIGAQPLPVLAAGVPCQNSWRGGNGQQGGIPFEKDLKGKPSPYTYNGKPLTMESYLQELLDLIEWANGDAKTSKLAQIRAKAGHPKPFNLKYLGIGNEDLIGDTFTERYLFLINGIKKVHPEITIVGTVGPFWEGSDYEYGWQLAKANKIDVVDEHYYNPIGWYLNHQDFYDKYDRNGTKVYLGEWASKGNRMENALAEAIHLTNVERNADVVVMSSYAPLLAKEGHTQWNPDLIYFNNTEVKPTPNYYVQMLWGQNAGDEYIYSSLKLNPDLKDIKNGWEIIRDAEKRVKCSVVKDKETGDIIIKLVNAIPTANTFDINIGNLEGYNKNAKVTYITGNVNDRNIEAPQNTYVATNNKFNYKMPKYSVAIIRINKAKK
ncbi:MAG: alpha-L-arabinofuranosidase [Bacteroidaceae bacterium]|nr:alpha-L-arabinofuranosidase [Bacteroidaceae bacterium]